jgi:hypothetical protein
MKMSNILDDYLNKEVDLKQLVKKIDFTDEEVEDAAAEHPKLFLRVARFRVQKMRDRVEAELAYEARLAKLGSKYRERKDEKGKRKLTEGPVSAKVQLDPKIGSLKRRMEMSHVHEKFAELLVTTYHKREFAIKIIMDARWAEVGKALKVMKEEGAKKMSKKLQEEVRSRYRQGRSSDE